ncbi:MAG: guanylate kinase [Candidatus Aminicenantes bacterium]|nr:guanylate kinase [Candidatus Aminicenantes bacterium]
MLFVVTGPSGSGKSTIVHHVLSDLRNLQFSVSHTTRPKRNSEEDGREYYFVSDKEFERMIARKRFVEWAVVHGHYYGTSKKEVEEKRERKDVILDIDVQGAAQIRRKYKKAVFVFVLPPRFQELKRRLEERGMDSPAVIRQRLRDAKKEIREYVHFGYIVVNDRLDKAVLELESIILSARCRLEVRKKDIRPIVRSFH